MTQKEQERQNQVLEERREEERLARRGTATRVADAKAAHRGNDPRAGIRAYCRGNRWLEENAKAVGNW